MNQLIFDYRCEDNLLYTKRIKSNSVRLIMTSPPYNIGLNYEKRVDIETYLKSFEPLIDELVRVLADDGSLCWQVGSYIPEGEDEIYPLDILFYPLFKSRGLKLRNRIIWTYGAGLNNKQRFSGRYETILWFTRSDDYIFNLDSVRVPQKYPGHTKKTKNGVKYTANPNGKNPGDVWNMTLEKLEEDWESLIWEIPRVGNRHPEKVEGHPCQFPVELVERCVLALTNEGDTVYDPFAGIGSTLIGATKNMRIGLGCDSQQIFVTHGLLRLEALAKGELKTRPMYKQANIPAPTHKVGQKPEKK